MSTILPDSSLDRITDDLDRFIGELGVLACSLPQGASEIEDVLERVQQEALRGMLERLAERIGEARDRLWQDYESVPENIAALALLKGRAS
jgi:hypothetical protein